MNLALVGVAMRVDPALEFTPELKNEFRFTERQEKKQPSLLGNTANQCSRPGTLVRF